MTVVLCLDDNNGMLFNNRRQSKDSLLIKDLLSYTSQKILINKFSEDLFSGFTDNVIISEDFLENAGTEEVCFVENIDLTKFEEKIEKLIVYRWNKVYPNDFRCNIRLDNYSLVEASDFQGSSHEKITRSVFRKC